MISKRPILPSLCQSDLMSAWEFKGSLLSSTCVLKNGSIVILVTSSACKNKSITLCCIKNPTRKIIKKNIFLQDPDTCRYIFAIGHLILVVGEKKGYLFNADLELQSFIQEILIPDSFVVWDENRFIIAREFGRPRLYDVTNPSKPVWSEILINEDIWPHPGISLFKLMDSLVICFTSHSFGCRDIRKLAFYSLNSSLTEGTCQHKASVDYKTGVYLDRRIFEVLPDRRIAEICTSDLYPKDAHAEPCQELIIYILIHAKNTTHSSSKDWTVIIWTLPHEEQDFQLGVGTHKDFSNLISIVDYSVLFLRQSGIAVYDLQNNLSYQIAFPINFRAEGMVVWNEQVIIYNKTSLYQFQFTALSPIIEEIKENIPILPTLIPIIIDYLNNDIKLSTHPSAIFSHQIPRLIDTSEFIPSKCNLM